MANDNSKIEWAKQRARELFLTKRANCAEAVFLAIHEAVETDLPQNVSALLTPLGGGVAIRGENCGAMLAGVIALGLVHGRHNPESGKLKTHRGGLWKTYSLFNQLPERFNRKYGTLSCWELTEGFTYGTKECRANCEDIIAETAGLAAQLLQEAEEGLDFGFQRCLLDQAGRATGLSVEELIDYKSEGRPFPLAPEEG